VVVTNQITLAFGPHEEMVGIEIIDAQQVALGNARRFFTSPGRLMSISFTNRMAPPRNRARLPAFQRPFPIAEIRNSH
jgi:hypothetical protein